MTQTRKAIPWRWVLPGVELLLCLVLIAQFLPLFIKQIRTGDSFPQLHKGVQEHATETGEETYHIFTPGTAEQQSALRLFELRYQIPVALNFPAAWFEVPRLMFTKDEYVPRGIQLQHWRAMKWPLLAVVFWYVVGRSWEALFALHRKRLSPCIRALDISIALFSLIAGALAIGLVTYVHATKLPSDAERNLIPLIGISGVLWVFLSLGTMVAWGLQWRLRRRSWSAADAESPAA